MNQVYEPHTPSKRQAAQVKALKYGRERRRALPMQKVYLAEQVNHRWLKGLVSFVAIVLGLALLIIVIAMLSGCAPAVQAQPENTVTPTVATTATLSPTLTQVPSVTPAICTVSTGLSTGTVNVRQGPGMNFTVVDWVSEGEQIILSDKREGNWQAVTTPRLVHGWFFTVRWCK